LEIEKRGMRKPYRVRMFLLKAPGTESRFIQPGKTGRKITGQPWKNYLN